MKHMLALAAVLLAVFILLVGCRAEPDAPAHTEPGSTSPQGNTAATEHTTAPADPTQDSINTENPFDFPSEPEETESEPVPSVPVESEPEVTAPEVIDPEDGEMTYRKFHDMTPSQQQAYVESFESLDAFFLWYSAAQEQYEKENPPIIIDGNGQIDLGAIAGNGN